jgi:hypothetical protein
MRDETAVSMGPPGRRLINCTFVKLPAHPVTTGEAQRGRPFLSMFLTSLFFPQSMPARSSPIRILAAWSILRHTEKRRFWYNTT